MVVGCDIKTVTQIPKWLFNFNSSVMGYAMNLPWISFHSVVYMELPLAVFHVCVCGWVHCISCHTLDICLSAAAHWRVLFNVNSTGHRLITSHLTLLLTYRKRFAVRLKLTRVNAPRANIKPPRKIWQNYTSIWCVWLCCSRRRHIYSTHKSGAPYPNKPFPIHSYRNLSSSAYIITITQFNRKQNGVPCALWTVQAMPRHSPLNVVTLGKKVQKNSASLSTRQCRVDAFFSVHLLSHLPGKHMQLRHTHTYLWWYRLYAVIEIALVISVARALARVPVTIIIIIIIIGTENQPTFCWWCKFVNDGNLFFRVRATSTRSQHDSIVGRIRECVCVPVWAKETVFLLM